MLFYGHTHINKIGNKDGIFTINLASITLPKEDNPHSYGVLDRDRFIIKDINGNIVDEANFN